MCIDLKYEVWNILQPEMTAVNALAGEGYPPLPAMVLSARGIRDGRAAHTYLDCSQPLEDPFLMGDMDLAVGRTALAMERREKIAVFGDYDVDGITATCLLTDFFRSHGADCLCYIPSRLEEGYGLNPIAIHRLHEEGVRLIITVDCGITAVEEALLCRELGMDLIITDHHECKESLPQAVAVVDPHRPGDGYPHQLLSGVGVAFKLAAALSGDQEALLEDYADLVCLGTVADVMPLQGENRAFVARGLDSIRHTRRPGIAALIEECGCTPDHICASTIGYNLGPRINAAGRMGQAELALDLFLTDDPQTARDRAQQLCALNRERQSIEAAIYQQAVEMLGTDSPPAAIVLADDHWHQGVVGIVASRLAEEFCCPAFLICLDGAHGKASSRSYGGFNLFTSLAALSELLESYGGHELAAGFTIAREQIPLFREQICQLASAYYTNSGPKTLLDVDCAIPAELLTIPNIDALSILEPCGCGCPKPLFAMEQLTVEHISMVGGGRHMRLRLRSPGGIPLNAIYFSASPESTSIAQGDVVDVAFEAQVNEYRGERSVQLNLQDIRPSCQAACSPQLHDYGRIRTGEPISDVSLLLPDRKVLGGIWRYLAGCGPVIREAPLCLCRKIVRYTGRPLNLGMLLTSLDIFSDVGLLQTRRHSKYLIIRLTAGSGKADLMQSQTMQTLLQAKER